MSLIDQYFSVFLVDWLHLYFTPFIQVELQKITNWSMHAETRINWKFWTIYICRENNLTENLLRHLLRIVQHWTYMFQIGATRFFIFHKYQYQTRASYQNACNGCTSFIGYKVWYLSYLLRGWFLCTSCLSCLTKN